MKTEILEVIEIKVGRKILLASVLLLLITIPVEANYDSNQTNSSLGPNDIPVETDILIATSDDISKFATKEEYLLKAPTTVLTSALFSGSTSKDDIMIKWGLKHENDYNDIIVLPVANFTTNVSEGYVPLTVQFNDNSENAISFNWDFGDGATSTEKDPIHTYSTAGIYTVNLTASNENGTDSKTAKINVSTQSAPPVFPGYTNPPTDPNHDGLYEDINGNGILDFNDVVAYYDNIDWIVENMQLEFFDYNKNGLIEFDDVVMLYDML
jgi:PKD repeat protein